MISSAVYLHLSRLYAVIMWTLREIHAYRTTPTLIYSVVGRLVNCLACLTVASARMGSKTRMKPMWIAGVCGECVQDSLGQDVVDEDLYALARSTGTKETTGIFKIENENVSKVDMYPNPTGGLITIEITQQGGNPTIKIYDLVGRRILAKTMDNPIIQIDISAFREGVYIVELETESDRVLQKIVKE